MKHHGICNTDIRINDVHLSAEFDNGIFRMDGMWPDGNHSTEILDGSIFLGLGEMLEDECYLGSTDGTDYTGSGKGVFAYSRGINDSEFYAGEEHIYRYISHYFIFNEPGTVTVTLKNRNSADDKPNEQPGNQSGSSSDGKTAITDKDASVSVNGVFPEGTALNASVKKNDNGSYTFDITPVDANGNKVQSDGAAVVMVPLPEEFKGKNVFVYRIEDGKYIGLQSWVDGDWLFFTTSHFSEFEITTEQRSDDNPDTGSAAGIGFSAVVLAGALLIVSKKKR